MLMFKQHEIDFLITERVSRVEADKGWCYVVCSKCSKKLQRTVTSFECARCNNLHAVGSLRYVAICYNMIVGCFFLPLASH